MVDDFCGRTFYAESSTTKYYTAEEGTLLRVDDLVSVTTLQTDEDGDRTYEISWTATDYDLEPFNAALEGKPYTAIWTTPKGIYAFPTVRKGVKIVGTWGWPAVPKKVKEATLLLAFRLFKAKDAPFGVVGSPEMGELRRMVSVFGSDVGVMLEQYQRLWIGG
jgi:hypothetical protein